MNQNWVSRGINWLPGWCRPAVGLVCRSRWIQTRHIIHHHRATTRCASQPRRRKIRLAAGSPTEEHLHPLWMGRRRQIRFVFFIHTSSDVGEERGRRERTRFSAVPLVYLGGRGRMRNLIIEIFNLQNQLCSERCLHLSNYYSYYNTIKKITERNEDHLRSHVCFPPAPLPGFPSLCRPAGATQIECNKLDCILI